MCALPPPPTDLRQCLDAMGATGPVPGMRVVLEVNRDECGLPADLEPRTTLVLELGFDNLKTDEDGISMMLLFSGCPLACEIPWSAIDLAVWPELSDGSDDEYMFVSTAYALEMEAARKVAVRREGMRLVQ